MARAVAIVTDSTASLPGELLAEYGVTVVPLRVAIGGVPRDEGRTRAAAETARHVRDRRPVTTSRPPPARFARAYRNAAAAGATGIVSVHLSGAMSGTVESARLAAKEAPVPVRVVDSRSIGMGLGFAALASARAAASGAALDEVAEAAVRRARATRSLFYVDTLEHLYRGGRIGGAASLVGSALMIKPLLHIANGRIGPLEKVRTAARALARLEDLAVELAGGHPVDLAVQHLDAPDRAETLAARLRERVAKPHEVYVGEVGPVIGAHVGPGLVGVAVSRRDE